MKQLLLLAAACCIITFAKAQITKGSIMIGGSFGYNYSDQKTTDTTPNYSSGTTNGFNIGISYGKCFKENAFWGITASFSYTDNKNIYSFNSSNNNSSQTRNYYLGIFERKYYPLITNLYVFGQAGFGYSYYSNDGTYVNINRKGYDIGLYVYPGISYKVSKKIYLESSLRNLVNLDFNHSEQTYLTQTTSSNNFTSNIQLPTQILQNLNVGMTIIIGK